VLLSDDLFRIPPQAIKDVRVRRTMVGGRWVHREEPLSP
jgi:predicted amidohydrolase YtcJ